jgi:hypothetical protein
MAEKIRALLLKQPFEPFTITVSDGREYHIPTPDHAHVLPNNVGVWVFADNVSTSFPMRQVSGVSLPLSGA